MKTSKNKSANYGKDGVVRGGTNYDQIKLNNKFEIQKESGLNKHKSNITTDKPYDFHINGK